ncbi:hypothetical protein HGM15179_016124, partial [Zosterops borbonicus]
CQKGNIAGEEDSGRQSDEAHLRKLEVFDPEKGRLKAGLIILCNYLTRRCSQSASLPSSLPAVEHMENGLYF